MVRTRINIKEHLAEYLNAKYFNPDEECVCLPDKLDLYHTIWNLLEKFPQGCKPLNTGNLTLGVPDRRGGKDPAYYNYLGERSIKIINRKVETLFLAELHDKLDHNKHVHGIEYQNTAHEFLCKYKIESISIDGVLKNYYRWRDVIRQKGARRKYKKSV